MPSESSCRERSARSLPLEEPHLRQPPRDAREPTPPLARPPDGPGLSDPPHTGTRPRTHVCHPLGQRKEEAGACTAPPHPRHCEGRRSVPTRPPSRLERKGQGGFRQFAETGRFPPSRALEDSRAPCLSTPTSAAPQPDSCGQCLCPRPPPLAQNPRKEQETKTKKDAVPDAHRPEQGPGGIYLTHNTKHGGGGRSGGYSRQRVARQPSAAPPLDQRGRDAPHSHSGTGSSPGRPLAPGRLLRRCPLGPGWGPHTRREEATPVPPSSLGDGGPWQGPHVHS